jgi:type IV fimbrial biogenesis protein FimT
MNTTTLTSPKCPWARCSRFAARGFTLLEALVVLGLLGILVSLAAPSLSRLQAKYRLQAQAEDFLSSLVLARSEALSRQQRVSLCAQSAQATCDSHGQWQQGWLVFVDDNHNGAREAQEALIELHVALPPEVNVGVKGTVKAYFSYGPEGRSMTTTGAFMAGTWQFCQPELPQGWKVVSNALGKPRIESYTSLACP